MTITPKLISSDGYELVPLAKSALTSILQAYKEDPESALSALPWLTTDKEIRQQIRDMLFDVESQRGSDKIHFWSIIHGDNNEFVGLIGLGDELQILHSNYNLGYWIRRQFRRQGIAIQCASAILEWLEQRQEFFRIEITVHPHNLAGLATAASICQRWNGEQIDEFIGIEIGNRTVPHRIHIVDIRGDND